MLFSAEKSEITFQIKIMIKLFCNPLLKFCEQGRLSLYLHLPLHLKNPYKKSTLHSTFDLNLREKLKLKLEHEIAVTFP